MPEKTAGNQWHMAILERAWMDGIQVNVWNMFFRS